jgi:hypothetical protein
MRAAEAQQAGLTEDKLAKVADYESSDLSERDKMALRYADQVKFHPQGVTEGFLAELRKHFSDAEISEIAFTIGVYGVTHHWSSSVGEDVLDETTGESLVDPEGPFGKDGFTQLYSALHRPLPDRD